MRPAEIRRKAVILPLPAMIPSVIWKILPVRVFCAHGAGLAPPWHQVEITEHPDCAQSVCKKLAEEGHKIGSQTPEAGDMDRGSLGRPQARQNGRGVQKGRAAKKGLSYSEAM